MFNQRVATAWEEVTERAAQTQGDLVVISHALVCRALVANHLSLARDMDAEVARWPNTALTIIEPQAPWLVSVLACGAHLDGVFADDSRAKS